MVNQGIVLGHIIYNMGIEVEKVKIELISKLPSPTNIKKLGNSLVMQASTEDSSKTSQTLLNPSTSS